MLPTHCEDIGCTSANHTRRKQTLAANITKRKQVCVWLYHVQAHEPRRDDMGLLWKHHLLTNSMRCCPHCIFIPGIAE